MRALARHRSAQPPDRVAGVAARAMNRPASAPPTPRARRHAYDFAQVSVFPPPRGYALEVDAPEAEELHEAAPGAFAGQVSAATAPVERAEGQRARRDSGHADEGRDRRGRRADDGRGGRLDRQRGNAGVRARDGPVRVACTRGTCNGDDHGLHRRTRDELQRDVHRRRRIEPEVHQVLGGRLRRGCAGRGDAMLCRHGADGRLVQERRVVRGSGAGDGRARLLARKGERGCGPQPPPEQELGSDEPREPRGGPRLELRLAAALEGRRLRVVDPEQVSRRRKRPLALRLENAADVRHHARRDDDRDEGRREGEADAVTEPALRVELEVDPAEVTPETADIVTVNGAVTNLGDAPIDTRVRYSQLRVNGEPLPSWRLAIGNGARDEREYALPPGERVEFSRVMGSGLLRGPGEYDVVLDVLGVQSRPARVTLTVV